MVYDVKPARRVADAQSQFAETARVCEQVGGRHEVLSETGPTRTANLAFLRATRLPRCHPPSEVFVRLLDLFEDGRFLGEGAAMLNRRHPALAMPYVKHLIWHRHLVDHRVEHGSPASAPLRQSGDLFSECDCRAVRVDAEESTDGQYEFDGAGTDRCVGRSASVPGMDPARRGRALQALRLGAVWVDVDTDRGSDETDWQVPDSRTTTF